jgi:HK97 family phage major capsid protein
VADKPDEKPAGLTLTHEQTVARLRDIEDEMSRLERRDDLDGDDEARFSDLATEAHSLADHKKKLERKAQLTAIREASRGRGGYVELPAGDDDEERGTPAFHAKQDPWDLSNVRTYGRSSDEVHAELRGRALTAIEKMPHATDTVREAGTKLIEEGAPENVRFALESSSPVYMQAFTKLMKTRGKAMLSDEEREAVTRAMSLTDSAGGYLIPYQLDPTVIITANGSRNPIRRIARVVNATGDVWNGITSAGVTGSWDAEAAEVSDDAPTLANPAIPVYKGAIFVPISFEAREDEANVAGEVARMIAFEKDRMESVAFVTGSGTGEPTGIVTALTGTASVVASATADTFAVGDVYALDSALPDRYRDGASWVSNRAIANLVRRFDTSGGAALWETLGGGLPPQLLGYPFYTAEGMDGTVTALADNYVAVLGDFSNYVIADRVGTTIDYIPHLFGANRRPTGQSGWYAHFRVGADSVNDGAFRMLNVT